jgi:hypothetical protein
MEPGDKSTADPKKAGDVLGDASKHATEPQNTTPTKPLKRRQQQKHFYKNRQRAKEIKENAAEIYLKTKKTESVAWRRQGCTCEETQ